MFFKSLSKSNIVVLVVFLFFSNIANANYLFDNYSDYQIVSCFGDKGNKLLSKVVKVVGYSLTISNDNTDINNVNVDSKHTVLVINTLDGSKFVIESFGDDIHVYTSYNFVQNNNTYHYKYCSFTSF